MENIVTLNIFFIDQKDEERKKSCVRTLPSEVFKQVDELSKAQIICAHSIELEGYDETGNTEYAKSNSPKLIILYGGGGNPFISDADFISQKVLRIGKRIPHSAENITNSDWVKIYNLIDIKKNIFLKNIFDAEENNLLSSLSILCQGYLISAISDPMLDSTLLTDSSINKVINALRLREKLLTNIQILDTNWFTKIFNSEQIQVLQSFNNPEINKVLGMVIIDNNISDLRDVAEAYFAVCKILSMS